MVDEPTMLVKVILEKDFLLTPEIVANLNHTQTAQLFKNSPMNIVDTYLGLDHTVNLPSQNQRLI